MVVTFWLHERKEVLPEGSSLLPAWRRDVAVLFNGRVHYIYTVDLRNVKRSNSVVNFAVFRENQPIEEFTKTLSALEQVASRGRFPYLTRSELREITREECQRLAEEATRPDTARHLRSRLAKI